MKGRLKRLYLKHKRTLKKKKRGIKETIETANLAYLERDKAFHQIDEINKLSQKESKEFDVELKELVESAKRRFPETERTQQKSGRDNTNQQTDFVSVEKRQTNGRRESKNKKTVNQKSEQAVYKELRNFELDYHKLVVATGIENFDDLSVKFKDIEEKNFQQYRYINELSQQIEDLERYNKDLESEKEGLENIEANTNLNRKDYLLTKHQEIEENSDKIDTIMTKNVDYDKQIKEAINELENLFYYLNCDKMLNKYTDDNPFAYGNLKSTLGLIEKEQDQLLYLYNLIIQSKNADQNEVEKNTKKKNKDVKIKKIGDLLQNGYLIR